MLSGIDVSHYQGPMNWETAASRGVSFAFIKATEGTTWVDPRVATNGYGALRAGILRGFYHYYINSLDPFEQAMRFIEITEHLEADLPPVVDVEDPKSALDVDSLRLFLAVVEDAIARPIIYTGFSYWNNLAGVPWASAYDLWIASYRLQPLIPADWYGEWVFWQFTSLGDGYGHGASSPAIDLNRYQGSLEDLKYYSRKAYSPVVLPRVPHNRVTWVIPGGLPWEQKAATYQEAARLGVTITGSYDASEWGTAVLFGLTVDQQQRFRNWHERHYDGVALEFRELY